MKSRLDKLLADNGFGSRRDIKKMLKGGIFLVNGAVRTDPGFMVDPEGDVFTHRGEPFLPRGEIYLMLNKPLGVVTSTSDPLHATVMDLLEERWRPFGLFPVGRLDYDTGGLLLLTNDGPLTHRLTSPKTGVDKTYRVLLRDAVDEPTFEEYRGRFERGVRFHDGHLTLPAVLELPRGHSFPAALVDLTIQEGKYHQVKKMFKVVGNEVAGLTRTAMGPLTLDPSLAPGSYRELTEAEVGALRGAARIKE